MNDGRHMRFTIFALVFTVCLSQGCAGLLTGESSQDIHVPTQRLRQIEPMDLSAMTQPAETEQAPTGLSTRPATTQPASAPAELTLSLAQCRAITMENNLDLKVELINPSIAATSVGEEEARFESLFFANAAGAKTDSPGVTRGDDSQSDSVTADGGLEIPLRTGGTIVIDHPVSWTEAEGSGSDGAVSTADLSASISQPLLRNAGVRTNTHAIRIARYESQISEARTKLEVIRVLAAVDRVYWRLYAARRELEVRKQQYDLAQAQLDKARRRVSSGLAAEVEIVRAEAGLAERLEAIIIAENNVRDRQRELKRVLNKPGLGVGTPTILVPGTEPNPVNYRLDAQRLAEAALANRMEMLELELRIAADASTMDFARNQALPLLAVEYTYNINGAGETMDDAYDLLFDSSYQDYRLGLKLEIPVGNAAARSRLHRTILTRLQRLATREQRALQIQQEVYTVVDQLQAAWQRVLASRRRSVLAWRLLQAEQRQYELGLRTSTDVLDAQASYADALSAEVRALTDYQIAQIDIAFATGTLLGASRIQWEPIESPDNREGAATRQKVQAVDATQAVGSQ